MKDELKITNLAVIVKIDGRCHTVNLTEKQRYQVFDAVVKAIDGEMNVSREISDLDLIDPSTEVDIPVTLNQPKKNIVLDKRKAK